MNKINNYSLFLFFCVFCMLCEFNKSNISFSLSQFVSNIIVFRKTYSSRINMKHAEVDMVNGHVSITNTDSKSYTNKKNGNKLLYDHNPFMERKKQIDKHNKVMEVSKRKVNQDKLLTLSPKLHSYQFDYLKQLIQLNTSQYCNYSSLIQPAIRKSFSPARLRNIHKKHPPNYITINSTIDSLSFNETYTHPQDPSNITFFPWNDDGIDYSATCSKLLSIIKSFSGPIIVNSGLRGGLGHKLVSFYHTIVIALILRRPFYCILILSFFLYVVDWEDIYLNNLNSCFQSLKFRGSIHSLLLSFTYRS